MLSTKTPLDNHKDYYCVYKLSIKDSQVFYIGYSKDLHQRLYTHSMSIIKIMSGLDKAMSETAKRPPFHYDFADAISGGKVFAKEILAERAYREKVSIEVLAIVENEHLAKTVEAYYINDSKANQSKRQDWPINQVVPKSEAFKNEPKDSIAQEISFKIGAIKLRHQ